MSHVRLRGAVLGAAVVSWSEERTNTLKVLWIEGLSASQIAKRLGGVSRNAVIGKVHRLGMTGRHQASRPTRVARVAPPKAPPKPQPVQVTRVAPPAPEPAPRPPEAKCDPVISPLARPWEERKTGECAWPIGERGAVQSCCNPVRAEGASYCLGHEALRVSSGKTRPIEPPKPDVNRAAYNRHMTRRDGGFARVI